MPLHTLHLRAAAEKRLRITAFLTSVSLTISLTSGFAARPTRQPTEGRQTLYVEESTSRSARAPAQSGSRISGTGQEIAVEDGARSTPRTVPVTVRNGDSHTTLLTQGESVGEVLDQLCLSVGPQDLLTADPALPAAEAEIRIVRNAISEHSETDPIPYESVRQSSSELYQGQERTIQAGVQGTRTRTYQVITVDGQSQSTLISDEITQQPVTEIVAYGTRVRPASRSPLSVSSQVLTNVEETGSGGILTTSSGERLTYTKKMSVTATAYTTERQSWKKTATGTIARVGAIAVDPRVIPYGTKLYIQTTDGSIVYGVATAEDCGGSIKGNRIDLFFNTYQECIQFGVRPCTIYILEPKSETT